MGRSDNGLREIARRGVHHHVNHRGDRRTLSFWELIMYPIGSFLVFLLSFNTRPIAHQPGLALVPATELATLATSAYSAAAGSQEQEWFYIHGTLNVRAEPRQNASIVRTLHRGDYVQLGSKDANGWARVYSAGAPEGYVYRASELVQSQAPTAQPASSAGRGSGGGSRRSGAGGRVYHMGPRGGCYYYTGSGSKQYVDRSNCN